MSIYVSKRINVLIWWFLFPAFVFLFPLTSFAATIGEICSDGIDNDASGGDAACSDTDLDRDGFTTTDCDDTNRHIFPGETDVAGCSAGNFRTCQSNGTYTACVSLSTFSCKSGSGVDYWIDDSVSTCDAANDYTHLSDIRCFSDTGMANYHDPVAGDCFIFYSRGTYTNGYTSSGVRTIFLNNQDGTNSDHIKINVRPGERWWELGIGSGVLISSGATLSNGAVKFTDSSYVDAANLEITTAGGVANTVGLWWNGGDHGHGWNNAVHGIRGSGGSNLSGIRVDSHATFEADHNRTYDNFEVGNLSNSDIQQILVMDVTDFNVHHNVVYNTSGNESGNGIKLKHGGAGSTLNKVQSNVIFNTYLSGISIGGYPNLTVSNNYLENVQTGNSGTAIQIVASDGGTPDYSNIVVEYNTIKNSPFFDIRPDDNAAVTGSPFANFRKNIVVDNRGSAYPSDGSDGFARLDHYGSDALYAEFITGGTLTIGSNCYYNSASTAIYETVFGDGAGNGTTYSTCAAMVAGSGTIAHTGSFCENPTLDADGRATSSNCALFGWKLTGGGGGSTSTTTIQPGVGGALPSIVY